MGLNIPTWLRLLLKRRLLLKSLQIFCHTKFPQKWKLYFRKFSFQRDFHWKQKMCFKNSFLNENFPTNPLSFPNVYSRELWAEYKSGRSARNNRHFRQRLSVNTFFETCRKKPLKRGHDGTEAAEVHSMFFCFTFLIIYLIHHIYAVESRFHAQSGNTKNYGITQ